MPSSSLKIINPLGLHARAASKFVGLAKSFSSSVELSKGDEAVDGKSIIVFWPDQ